MSDTPATDTPAEAAPQTAAASTDTPAPTPPASDGDSLGDGGKKALAAERSARRAAEKAAAEALARVKEFEDQGKTELERLTEQIAQADARAKQAESEALRLRVAADTGLPSDLQEFLTGDSEEQLRERAAKLMAATNAASEPRRPAPDPSQGAKTTSGAGDQLTRADLARMTPQQIREAQDAGRFADLMAGRI